MNGSSITNSLYPLSRRPDGEHSVSSPESHPSGVVGGAFDGLQAALAKQNKDLLHLTGEFMSAHHSATVLGLQQLLSDYHTNVQVAVGKARGALKAQAIDSGSLTLAVSEGSAGNSGGNKKEPKTSQGSAKETKFDDQTFVLEFKQGDDYNEQYSSQPSRILSSTPSISRVLQAKANLKEMMTKQTSSFGDASCSVGLASSSPVRLRQAKSDVEGSYMELMKQLRDESLIDTILWKMGVTNEDMDRFETILTQQHFRFLGPLRTLVNTNAFNALSMILIVLNAVFIAVDLDIHAHRSAEAFQQRNQGMNAYAITPDWVDTLDVFFCTAFTCELVIRVLAGELSFFFGPDWRWNILDMILVLTSLVDVVMVSTSDGTVDMSFVRILRLGRVMRTLRIIRVMRFFRELRLIMLAIVSAMGPLLWALVFLTLIMFLVSIVFLQGMENYVSNAVVHDATASAIIKHFPDFPKTMLTLFMSITGGLNWVEIQAVVADVSEAYRFIFLCYIALMVLGVLNIITGIFVESSGELAQLDRDLVTQGELEKNNLWMQELTKLFKELDINKNGTITLEEFTEHASKDHVQAFFGALQLDVTKAVDLFELLDVDGSMELEIDEFVIGCMRLKGMAKSIDMETVLAENRKLVKRWAKHFHNIERNNHKISSQLVALSSLLNLSGVSIADIQNVTSSSQDFFAPPISSI